MPKAYLTIDDSPTRISLNLCHYLKDNDIPAIFYCRGDHIEQHFDVTVEMIRMGFVIGNHGYAHKRAVGLSYDDIIEDISRCEDLIDGAYTAAGVKRPGKYYRFPYLDRGCGAWIVDFDKMPDDVRRIVHGLFADGLYLDDTRPTDALVEKKHKLQYWLADQGFTLPFSGVSFPWYQHPQMAGALDALYTFSTSDWMMTARHLSKDHPYKSTEDLKGKIDSDPYLFNEKHNYIVLIHDQEELEDVFKALIDHMVKCGIRFLPVNPHP